MKKFGILLTILIISGLLTACKGPTQGDAPGAAVEKYFQAIVSGDADSIATLSCPDWEATARGEVDAFAGVKARLDETACKSVSNQKDQAVVECSGGIIATYNNEDQNFDMTGRRFNVVQQNGEWLVCGYGQ